MMETPGSGHRITPCTSEPPRDISQELEGITDIILKDSLYGSTEDHQGAERRKGLRHQMSFRVWTYPLIYVRQQPKLMELTVG